MLLSRRRVGPGAEQGRMIIRATRDSLSQRDVPDPESHPCVFEGDGDNGIETCFETGANRQTYLGLKLEERKVLQGANSDDYVAEG